MAMPNMKLIGDGGGGDGGGGGATKNIISPKFSNFGDIITHSPITHQ